MPAAWSILSARSRFHFRSKPSHLDTGLASQAALKVHQTTTDLVAHGRLAVLGGVHSLAASGGSAASGSALGSKRSLASMTMVADAAGVCGGLPCGGGSASDGVSGSGLRDTGVLCGLLASQAGEETWLAAGGGGGSGGCASAGHDDVCVDWMVSWLVGCVKNVSKFCGVSLSFEDVVVERKKRKPEA